jgi:hypothetical protein
MMVIAVPDLLLDLENPDYSEFVLQRTDLTQVMNYGMSVRQSPRVGIWSAYFLRSKS